MESLPPPAVVEDLCGVVQLYSDGSIFRSDIKLDIPIQEDPSVEWKDCQFDETNRLTLRLYKPRSNLAASARKLPVLYFIHGGGFCVGSCTWANNHNACMRLASGLQAVVVAPDYRLAPEHRLPAALEDALASLKWLQVQAEVSASDDPSSGETWLRDVDVDFGSVFILGESAGGNTAHQLAVQLGPDSPELAPVRIRGYVLMSPFFSGEARTKSEAEGLPEPLFDLETLDRFWRLSLPEGKNRDHPMANPFGPSSRNLEGLMLDPMMVMVGGKELLRDRVEDYARRLKDMGKKVSYMEIEDEFHGFFLNNPRSDLGQRILNEINDFMARVNFLTIQSH